MNSDELLSQQDIAELRVQASQLRSAMLASHKLDSREAGWLPTRAMGSGMDYAESRLYQQGDEPRTINWRLSARSTETYVKTYHMESRPSLCIVLDIRRSMVFGTRIRLKVIQALRLASVLAFAAEQHRLSLNVLLLGETEEWLEEQSADALIHLLNTKLQQAMQPKVESIHEINLGEQLTSLSQRLEQGSLLYLISDFIDLDESHQKSLFQLQDQYFVQALHVLDPAEQKVQKLGGVSLQDMKSNAFLSLKTVDNNKESRLNEALSEHFSQIKSILLKSAVQYSFVPSNQESLHADITFPLGH